MVHTRTSRRSLLRGGFTIIEIGVVVMIIGLLAAVLLPGIYRGLDSARYTGTTTALNKVQLAITEYKQHTGQYPESLYDLIRKPENVKKWIGPYIDEANLLDGYKDELQYERTPQGEHPYELYSWGGQEGNPEEKHISVWDLE